MNRRTATTMLRAAATFTVALILAACSTPDPAPEAERSILLASATLPTANVDELTLPFAFQELPTYELPFDSTPEFLDGILFGLQETSGVLEFSAVTTAGKLLWSTQRPATCSGFTLTTSGHTPIAILTDVRTTETALAQTLASAYNLRTGELLWGPIPVPGPWHGPGTIFAPAAPPSAMGEVGERSLLDPATGAPLDPGGLAVGEFHGTILTIIDGELRASGAHDWAIPIADLAPGVAQVDSQVGALPGAHHPYGYALLTVDHAPTGAIVDLRDGRVITTSATSAAWDPAAETLVVVEPGRLAGYSEDGPLWSRALGEGMRVSTSGGVLTYLRSDSAVQVVNAVTGDDAVGYSPDATQYAIPALITPDGAGVFSFDEMILVGTYEAPES